MFNCILISSPVPGSSVGWISFSVQRLELYLGMHLDFNAQYISFVEQLAAGISISLICVKIKLGLLIFVQKCLTILQIIRFKYLFAVCALSLV